MGAPTRQEQDNNTLPDAVEIAIPLRGTEVAASSYLIQLLGVCVDASLRSPTHNDANLHPTDS